MGVLTFQHSTAPGTWERLCREGGAREAFLQVWTGGQWGTCSIPSGFKSSSTLFLPYLMSWLQFFRQQSLFQKAARVVHVITDLTMLLFPLHPSHCSQVLLGEFRLCKVLLTPSAVPLMLSAPYPLAPWSLRYIAWGGP